MDNQYIDQIDEYVNDSIATKQRVAASARLKLKIAASAKLCIDALETGNKIILAGNGGSAADSQHIAAELVGRFEFDRPGLASLALSTDTSILTTIGNDYGYNKIFERQLQANGRRGDVFIGITTSGKSENIELALHSALQIGMKRIVFTGDNGLLDEKAEIVIDIPSSNTARIQESHILVGHCICGVVERHIFGKK